MSSEGGDVTTAVTMAEVRPEAASSMEWQAALHQFRVREPGDPELVAKLMSAAQACRVRSCRRRAILAVPDDDEAISAEILQRQYVAQRGRCAICRRPMTVGPAKMPGIAGVHSYWSISVDRVDASSPARSYASSSQAEKMPSARMDSARSDGQQQLSATSSRETAPVRSDATFSDALRGSCGQIWENCRLVHMHCNGRKAERDALGRARAHRDRILRLLDFYGAVEKVAGAEIGRGLAAIRAFEGLVECSVSGPFAYNTARRPVGDGGELWKRCHATAGCNEWRRAVDFDPAPGRFAAAAASAPGAYGEIECGRWYDAVCRPCRQVGQAKEAIHVGDDFADKLQALIDTENRIGQARLFLRWAAGETGPVPGPVAHPRQAALAQWAAQRGLCARCRTSMLRRARKNDMSRRGRTEPNNDTPRDEKDDIHWVRWEMTDDGRGWRWSHARCHSQNQPDVQARVALESESVRLAERLRSAQRTIPISQSTGEGGHVENEWALRELTEQAAVVARQAVDAVGWTRDLGRVAHLDPGAIGDVHRMWDEAFVVYRRFNERDADDLLRGRAHELATATMRRAAANAQHAPKRRRLAGAAVLRAPPVRVPPPSHTIMPPSPVHTTVPSLPAPPVPIGLTRSPPSVLHTAMPPPPGPLVAASPPPRPPTPGVTPVLTERPAPLSSDVGELAVDGPLSAAVEHHVARLSGTPAAEVRRKVAISNSPPPSTAQQPLRRRQPGVANDPTLASTTRQPLGGRQLGDPIPPSTTRQPLGGRQLGDPIPPSTTQQPLGRRQLGDPIPPSTTQQPLGRRQLGDPIPPSTTQQPLSRRQPAVAMSRSCTAPDAKEINVGERRDRGQATIVWRRGGASELGDCGLRSLIAAGQPINPPPRRPRPQPRSS